MKWPMIWRRDIKLTYKGEKYEMCIGIDICGSKKCFNEDYDTYVRNGTCECKKNILPVIYIDLLRWEYGSYEKTWITLTNYIFRDFKIKVKDLTLKDFIKIFRKKISKTGCNSEMRYCKDYCKDNKIIHLKKEAYEYCSPHNIIFKIFKEYEKKLDKANKQYE